MVQDKIHVSFYRFVRLGNPEPLVELRSRVKAYCVGLQLRGTILLAEEGVNGMVTGAPDAISAFRAFIREEFGIQEKDVKQAPVGSDSFSRMLVKVKKEIITVGDPDLRVDENTAPRLSPAELKQWLDEGRPALLLDTRNRYEIEIGTFTGAEPIDIDTSRQFSAKAKARFAEHGDLPVITFCTGGIRCEKASALLLKQGLKNVFQLDGGILRYFEENGSAHFGGNCFVFDMRLAVDGELKPVTRTDDPAQPFGRHRFKLHTIKLHTRQS